MGLLYADVMVRRHDVYEIDDDLARVDFARVQGWLSRTYWNEGVSREVVERAARYSAMVVGAYADGVQVGYLRVVSDRTSFAWVADVYVEEGHRRRGLALAMVRFAVEHPEYSLVRKWMLGTRDAQGVYAKVGFRVVDKPQNLMYLRRERDGGVEPRVASDAAKCGRG